MTNLETENAELKGLLQECHVKLVDVQGTQASKQYAAALIPRVAEAIQRETPLNALDELGKRRNWELSYGELDASDENGEQGGRVHSRNGGRSDLEWTLRGTGETPRAALAKAHPITPKGEEA